VSMTLPISVQICTLNEAGNIRACLESVRENDPAEILVIDGGSTDGTAEIAKEFGANVLTPGKLGLGPSRKLGYMFTKCEYVAFIDADDLVPANWLESMLHELNQGGYSALQSSLQAANTETWWGRGWDQYFRESVRPAPDTNMVGRPALFVTAALQSCDADFASLDEDTHMSRSFELRGLRQGIAQTQAVRIVEENWKDNAAKWRSYGRGYRGFVLEHPERRKAILRHMLYTIPITRSLRPLKSGHVSQPLFGALMATQILWGWQLGKVKN